jgi:DNA modification methylase
MNKLIHGDCLEVMKKIPDKSIDMILCDLPYGTTQCKWDTIIPFEKLWELYNRIIKDNGAIALFGQEPFSSYLRISNIKMYKYDWKWDKLVGTGHLNAKKQPLRVFEDISIFYKKQTSYNPQMLKREDIENYIKKRGQAYDTRTSVYGKFKTPSREYFTEDKVEFKYPSNKITINCRSEELNSKHRIHPSQKPVALCEYLIKTYTNENELVLDNCMGSGSTIIACLNTNRKYIGIEMDENYFNIAKDRIEKHINNINNSELKGE